jgi:preprotein translocase subunit SecE
MFKNLISYFKDSYNEMVNHVTWASYAELQSSSVLVLVASLILTVVIWAMDLGFNGALNAFYNSFGN